MERKAVSGVLMTMLLISMLMLAFNIRPLKAEPTMVIVPDDYPTIQEAINIANEGDTIYVKTGTYYEHVVVNKTVTLAGEDKGTTFIDGSQSGNVVNITANKVLLTNFTIRNSGFPYIGVYLESSDNTISGNIISNNVYGLRVKENIALRNSIIDNLLTNNDRAMYIYGSNFNNISRNEILDNNNGIGVFASDYCTINNNTVVRNGEGIRLWVSAWTTVANNTLSKNFYNFGVYGYFAQQNIETSNQVNGKPIYYWINQYGKQVPTDAGYVAVVASTNILVKGLTITNNKEGLLLAYTTNSVIENLSLSYNEIGIYMVDSSNNVIRNNSISNNYEGIYMRGNDNTIYHNNFVNNTLQVEQTLGSNTWDDGYPSGGNYWSDFSTRYPSVADEYNGENQDILGSDGIWDSQYVIDVNNIDRYPFTQQDGWKVLPPPPPVGVPESNFSFSLLISIITALYIIIKQRFVKMPQ